MPIHDWTRVPAGLFHDFHHIWIAAIRRALNAGLLPRDYYALAEQTAGRVVPDVLTLQYTDPAAGGADPTAPAGTSVLVAPPRVRFHDRARVPFTRRAKSVVVRHVSGDRVVAVVEVVSPGNKGSRNELRAFVDKAAALLRAGVQLLVLDVFPPGPRDTQGIHRAIWSELSDTDFELPPDKRLTMAAYAAGAGAEAFVEPVAVGDAVPEMPLFRTADVYVPVPLELTY